MALTFLSLIKEYSEKVTNQLLDLYKGQTTDSPDQIKANINRFSQITGALRQKVEAKDRAILMMIPKDLQEKNRYLDITQYQSYDTLLKIIKAVSKKKVDIYAQAIDYFKKTNINIDEIIIKNYVARFKANIKDLEEKVEGGDEEAKNFIPKEILKNKAYTSITNWRKLEDVERMLDTLYPYQSKETSDDNVENSAEVDSDLIYSKDGLEIYRGDSEHKCVRYGKNGYYSWCISYPGGRSMYSGYRFRGEAGSNRMFYFVFDRTQPDTKLATRGFENKYHVVAIHTTEEGKYSRTTANNGDEETPTTWANLGRQFIADGPDGVRMWNKIKNLEHLFKFIPPSKDELRQSLHVHQ